MSNISDLYPILRCLLGDRLVMGSFNYCEADLLSAVRTTFALGRGPAGYALGGAVSTATTITPDLATGDSTALACYESVLLIIAGEDGMKVVRTRELTVHDGGDRKKDLLLEMKAQIHEIRDGKAVFHSRQSLMEFLTAGGINWADFTEFNLVTLPGPINV